MSMSDLNTSVQLEPAGTRPIGLFEAREMGLKGRQQLATLDEIEADFEDMRAAWNWAVEQGNYDLIDRAMESLDLFCTMRGRRLEADALFGLAREQLAPGPGEEPHPVWGRLVARYPDPSLDRQAQIERSLAIAQQHGDRAETAFCLGALGDIAAASDDSPQALSLYQKSLAQYRDLEDNFDVSATLSKLAETYRLLGEPEQAIASARQSLDLSRQIGDRFWAARSLASTGVISFYAGSYAEAQGYLQEANAIYHEMGYQAGVADTGLVLSRLAFVRADWKRARTLARQALEIATDLGHAAIVESAQEVERLTNQTWEDHVWARKPHSEPDMPAEIDGYKLEQLLGAGGLGAVFLTHDPDSGRKVALKVGYKEKLQELALLAPFSRREAEILVGLQHPALLSIYGCGETADYIYTVLEFLEGTTLNVVLEEQDGFLSEQAVIDWAVQICDALAYIHGLRPTPIIHRDLKPPNIGIQPDGRVRLLDFGIAESYQAGREQAFYGTPGYVSPEQYFGYSDARSDVYALGATLHHLVTRRDPRKAKLFSFHETRPRSLNPEVSEALEAVILKATEHNPEDRYQSATELEAALLACL